MAMIRRRSDQLENGQCASGAGQVIIGIGGLVVGLFFIVVSAIVRPSEAAEWSVQPSLGTRGIYNSNLLLTPQPHSASYGYWITPAAEFSGTTERLEVSSKIAADFTGYFGGKDTQFTNVLLPVSVRYKTEKDIIGFTGGYIRDNTLLSELQATGVVLDFTQRNQLTANPSWTRQLTEKLSFQMGAQFAYTRYESGNSALAGRLVDYRIVGGSGGLLYQVTERDQLQLTGVYTDFQTLASLFPFQSSYPGVSMGWAHAFDESMTGTIYGGPKFLSATVGRGNQGEVTTHDTVWVTGGTLSKHFERAMIQATIGRDLVPTGLGVLIAKNQAQVTGTYDLSETVTCSLDVVGSLSSGQTDAANGASFRDRQYVSVRPAISWKFQEWMEAELSYMYRRQSLEQFSTDVAGFPHLGQSHAVTVMFTYLPPKLSFSR